MSESQARDEIVRVGRSLFERGYVHGTTGNISVRLDDGYLITPTDACLGLLDPAELSRIGRTGQHVGGAKPSKSIVLHRRIYEADEMAACVIHTHSRELVALSLDPPDGEFLPPITPYFVMKVGHVPLIPYFTPGDEGAADLVEQAIRDAAASGAPVRAVMLERLGPNVWNSSPLAAMATLEELEETALLFNRSGRAATPLSDAAIEQLRERFGTRW